MTTIRIPTPLRAYTEGKSEIELEADSVGSALQALARRFPSVEPHLFDDQGAVRSYVNLFVNNEDIRNLQGHDTPTTDNDRVMIIPSIAGGKS